MNLPIQSQPVMRNVSTSAFSNGVETSSFLCTICQAGCNAISNPIAKAACNFACNHGPCS